MGRGPSFDNHTEQSRQFYFFYFTLVKVDESVGIYMMPKNLVLGFGGLKVKISAGNILIKSSDWCL